MALKGLRFAGMEMRNLAASKVMWLVAAAIAIIPLLYGALYLAAFQDPYERIDELPVAVVNEDAGATIAGERRVLGDDVVDELKKTTDGLQWHFVSAEEARRGLEGGTYFMTCTIPADFSSAASSVDADAPRRAQLVVEYNESENMLASQIGLTVWKEVRTRVSDAIANQYWTTVLDRVAATGDELAQAAEGAGELASGLASARSGSLTLESGLGELASGASSLEVGLGRLGQGARTLDDGVGSLSAGADALAAGTGELASGLGRLRQQTAGLPASTQELASGVDGAVGTLEGIAAGIGPDDATGSSTPMGGLNQVRAGLGEVSDDARALEGSLDALKSGLGAAQNAMNDINEVATDGLAALDNPALSDAQKLEEARTALSLVAKGTSERGEVKAALPSHLEQERTRAAAAKEAAKGISNATGSSSELQGGVAAIRATLAGVRDDINADAAHLQALRQGSAQLASSSSDLTAALGALSAGAEEVDGGARAAVAGTGKLLSGASQLAADTASALSGATRLAAGASELQAGSASLASGLASAVEGSDELSEQLASGARTAAAQAEHAGEKAQVASSPVELSNEYYTKVKNYGTGFAPYFMALGIWVGCLVAGFVFKSLNGRLILSGANPVMVAFANYAPMAAFTLLQALLLMLVIQFGLRLQIDNVPGFYAVGFLTALVYAAVMQLLSAAFGFSGRFVAIILLMLQLTSSAGTFPIQTAPAFFQVVSPFLPMTYAVEALRQVMTGLDYSLVAFDCVVLVCFGLACFALTAVVAWRKRIVSMEGLHPLIDLS